MSWSVALTRAQPMYAKGHLSAFAPGYQCVRPPVRRPGLMDTLGLPAWGWFGGQLPCAAFGTTRALAAASKGQRAHALIQERVR